MGQMLGDVDQYLEIMVGKNNITFYFIEGCHISHGLKNR
jgi:hypothetical protein